MRHGFNKQPIFHDTQNKRLTDPGMTDPSEAQKALAVAAAELGKALEGTSTPKAAHLFLLQAAKLDPTVARAFASLGYYYEWQRDGTRAIGCYKKALSLDPSEPIAGRALVRLAGSGSLESVLQRADTGAWAWRAKAVQTAAEGMDELAVVAFLKALRCPDLQPSQFYAAPGSPVENERGVVLADLAACYRRLGRYTAAIRSYHAALKEWHEQPPSDILCRCAQGTSAHSASSGCATYASRSPVYFRS
jgi:tetratricopeptide (TPR) repeat protein